MKLTLNEQIVLNLFGNNKTVKEIATKEIRSINSINAQHKSAKIKLVCKTDH